MTTFFILPLSGYSIRGTENCKTMIKALEAPNYRYIMCNILIIFYCK